MRKAIFLTLLLTALGATPALAQEVDFATGGFVALPVGLQVSLDSVSGLTNDPSFLAPAQQWDTSFLAPSTNSSGTDTTTNAAALDTATVNSAPTDINDTGGTAYQNASQGDAMHTSSKTGEGPQGVAPNTTSTTGPQNAGLNLPPCCYGIL
jgi:hypothetical protein